MARWLGPAAARHYPLHALAGELCDPIERQDLVDPALDVGLK
jgi:hypothetical protein